MHRSHWGHRPALLFLISLIVSIAAAPPPLESGRDTLAVWAPNLAKRDGHSHHKAPLLELNETEVTMHHAPTPPSYWSIDIDDQDSSAARYPGLMTLHVILMCSAFFFALPMSELYLN
jgi:hypothetical protein